MTDLVISPYNNSHCYVFGQESVERELSDEFSYEVPGAEFMKRGFRRNWNGRIYMLNRQTNLIYTGLAPRIEIWAKRKGYIVENRLPAITTDWSDFDTQALITKYPTPHAVRDYQQEAITHAMHNQRCVLLSPTASGKSLILYYIVRARMDFGKVLLVVPTISLVSQMYGDWEQYGWSGISRNVHKITAGISKDTSKKVIVSTWQSIYKQPTEWFEQFNSVLGDEAHGYKSDALRGIMEKMPHCCFRIGATGTLDETKSHKMVVEGVFGKSHRVAKTVDLQEQGHLAQIKIQAHFLQYDKYDRWFISEHKRKYAEEIDYLVQHKQRMAWLVDFLGKLSGNVLVLFQFIEKHGDPLYEALKVAYGKTRPIHFVSGKVSGDDREDIRALIETQSSAIIAASFGVFSTGVNVKKLHHIVFASPSKSKYRVLQSIGRGLRLHSSKKTLYVHDVVDDAHEAIYNNYAYKHWKSRAKFYKDEEFSVEQYSHELPISKSEKI
jgi:superfamily II DNA or RNA helicase